MATYQSDSDETDVITSVQRRLEAYTASNCRDKTVATRQRTESSDDKGHTSSDNEHMTNISREELDAKLQVLQVSLDHRVQSIESSVLAFSAEASRLRNEMSHAKWWAIGTAFAVLSIFAGVLMWGLTAQKDENARFNSYMREDVKEISSSVREISSAVQELRLRMEERNNEQ